MQRKIGNTFIIIGSILVLISILMLIVTGCSKEELPEDDEDIRDTSIEITMDTTVPTSAGTILSVNDVAQIRQDKVDIIQQVGFLVDGSNFQEDYTVVEGENNAIVIAQFTDGTDASAVLVFTGVKSENNIPAELLDNFNNENTIVSNGLTLTELEGYEMNSAVGEITINDIVVDNIVTYTALDLDNNISSVDIQAIDGTKESLLELSRDAVKVLFGNILSEMVEESELEALLAVEGNEEKLTTALDEFYNGIITTVRDEVITPAEFYNVDGTTATTPVEVTYLDGSFLSGGNKVPLSYAQYLDVDGKLIGITYTTKNLYTEEEEGDETETPEVSKIKIDETVFEEGGVKDLFTKVFEGVTPAEFGVGVQSLTDVSFIENSIIIGELATEESEEPIVDNTIDVEDTEPDVAEVVDIKDSQRMPYEERFKEYYSWPANENQRYSRYIYILSGLTDTTGASQFVGSIINKKDGTIRVSGGSNDDGYSLDMTTGSSQTGVTNEHKNNTDTSDHQTVILTGSSGRNYSFSNANIDGIKFDTSTATAGMISLTLNNNKYYIATMTPTEISRVIGSTGTRPEQSLYATNDFKGGEFLVTKDSSITDKTTGYTIKYTSIADGEEKNVPYMVCLPTLSSQDWLVVYGDNFPESMSLLSRILTETVVQ